MMFKGKDLLRSSLVSMLVFGSITVLTTGCISATRSLGIDTSSNKEQDAAFTTGDYNKSATLAYNEKDLDTDMDNDNLLPTLKAGNAYLFAHNYSATNKMLSEAENIIKYQREQILVSSIADYTAQLLLNDAAIEYHSNMTDSIMLNTYKAIALMNDEKFADARVEFNRAIDRQRRAKEEYAKLIGKQKDVIASKESEKKDGSGDSGLKKTLDNKDVKQQIGAHYSNLDTLKAYPDFINPFTTYLAGLYFEINGDYQKSVDLLKDASGMMPNNTVVKSDFKMVNAALSGKQIHKHYAWVIFENGFASYKDEFKINIPVSLPNGHVRNVPIALPILKPRLQAFSSISVDTKNGKSVKTEVVADMDRVVLTEFKYSYNDILTRAFLSAALKTVVQYETEKNAGAGFGMAMGLLNSATTHADTRTWSTLPKNFQVARVEIPKNHTLNLKIGTTNKSVTIGKDAKNAIVYVRIAAAVSAPSISVVNF